MRGHANALLATQSTGRGHRPARVRSGSCRTTPISWASPAPRPMADYYQLMVRTLTRLGRSPDEARRCCALCACARGSGDRALEDYTATE